METASRNHALQVNGLTKRFGHFLAVNNVSLAVREHHIHGIIRPNGAGKTTIFNLLTKFLSPTAGTIAYRGEDITALGPVAIARKGIVRSFQISAVFPNLTVLQTSRTRRRSKRLSNWSRAVSVDSTRSLSMPAQYVMWRGRWLNPPSVPCHVSLLSAAAARPTRRQASGSRPRGRHRVHRGGRRRAGSGSR